MTHPIKHQSGFTLIELMLALAFVAFIILFAVTTVIQVMQTYNKGLAVKQISQAGRTTLEDLTRFLRTADPGAVNVSALNSGRACFGGVSYVWNVYNASTPNKYDDNSAFTFVRVSDAASAMCNNSSGSYPQVPKAQATDILTGNIWVMQVAISAPSVSNPLVDLNIQLAVANDPALSSGQCAQGGSAGQFCATSNFTTTVMTGGGE
jgi:prepilin-type N-terminal cleavage/methylation domain-containing protein